MSRRVTGWQLALVGVCGCKLAGHVVTFAALAQLALPFWLPPRRAALSDFCAAFSLPGSRFAVASRQSCGTPRVLPHASELAEIAYHRRCDWRGREQTDVHRPRVAVRDGCRGIEGVD